MLYSHYKVENDLHTMLFSYVLYFKLLHIVYPFWRYWLIEQNTICTQCTCNCIPERFWCHKSHGKILAVNLPCYLRVLYRTSSPGLRKWLADTYYSIDAGTSTEELCKELAQTKSRTAENQNSASSHDGVNAERTGMLSRFEQWATQATRKMVALVHSPSDKSSDRQPNTVQTSPTQLRNSSAMQGFHPHACPDTWMNIQLQRCSVNGWFGIKIECVKSGFSIVHVTDAVANRSSAPVNVGDYIEKINGM